MFDYKSNSILYLIAIIKLCTSQQNLATYCPRMLHQVFEGFAPVGNMNSGNFTETSATDIRTCMIDCCKLGGAICNVAFLYNQKCYHVHCATDNLCLPKRKNDTLNLQMVLVSPVAEGN